MRTFRSVASRFTALFATLVLLAACGGESTGPAPMSPFEGTWRLVRLGGQPLPRRVDSVEVVNESLTFFVIGTGFFTDRWREHGSAVVARECTAWLSYTLAGQQMQTRNNPSQPQQGSCAAGITDRTFVLDGDTLRSSGGSAFRLGNLSRAYVRE
jgi:hypothetical protein